MHSKAHYFEGDYIYFIVAVERSNKLVELQKHATS